MNQMQKQIIKWLANGETGLSSKTMAFVIGFGVVPKRVSYPHDPSDLRRCMQLLDIAPEMCLYLDKMSEIHPVWAEIVNNWEELESVYHAEISQKQMPKTYELLQKFGTKDTNRISLGNGVSISFS